MADPTISKISSNGRVTIPKKIRSDFGIHGGDYLTISLEGDRIIFRKAKIAIDYDNPDDAWKEHAKRLLACD